MQPPFDIAADLDTPVSTYLKLGPLKPRFLLESVEKGTHLARYSFLGFGEALEFRLDEADQTFLNALAMPFAYPVAREHVEALEQAEGMDAVGRQPIGAGPFAFSRWERGVQVELERFDDYWAPAARPDRMVFLENISGDVASARFRNGDLDIIYRPSKVNRLFLRESEAWAPYRSESPSASVFALGLNCELPPFDNVHVRRAVAFAIDRSKLERLDPGQVIAATQILPPMLAPHVQSKYSSFRWA